MFDSIKNCGNPVSMNMTPGLMMRTHPKSFFKIYSIGSQQLEHVLTRQPKIDIGYYLDVKILQIMPIENGYVLLELIDIDDDDEEE